MPVLLIVGISPGLAKTNKSYSPSTSDWTAKTIPSRSKNPDLSTCWGRVLQFADSSVPDGCHILAFHPRQDEYPKFHQTLKSRHRLVWGDSAQLREYGQSGFFKYVDSLLDFEKVWRTQIRPAGMISPLVLPQPSFKAGGKFSYAWDRSHYVSLLKDSISDIADLLKAFRREFRRRGVWIDDNDIEFKSATASGLHAVAPVSRQWKFTLKLHPQFHYDVRHQRGGKFTLTDAEGNRSRFNKHANVDAHGYLRGGS